MLVTDTTTEADACTFVHTAVVPVLEIRVGSELKGMDVVLAVVLPYNPDTVNVGWHLVYRGTFTPNEKLRVFWSQG